MGIHRVKNAATMIMILMMTICIAGCGNDEITRSEEVSDSGFYLDTECTISIYDIEEDKGEALISNAFELCETYENLLSKTIKTSDIYKVNHAGGEPVDVDDMTVDVVELGLKMSKESEGVFDITVGRLTDLWDFKSEEPKLPEDQTLKDAVETVDYNNVIIEGNKIRIKDGKGRIDLGGVAKGYISYKLAELLKDGGVRHAIINLGGNVVTIGSRVDGSKWNVGIQDPNAPGQDIIGATKAEDQAVITSGIYERKFELDGKIYHHIIDPKTGYPVENDIVGVTLKCDSENAGMCDAYSTICLLKGTEEGKRFIEGKEGFEALFYDRDGKVIRTEGMDFETVSQ